MIWNSQKEFSPIKVDLLKQNMKVKTLLYNTFNCLIVSFSNTIFKC